MLDQIQAEIILDLMVAVNEAFNYKFEMKQGCSGRSDGTENLESRVKLLIIFGLDLEKSGIFTITIH